MPSHSVLDVDGDTTHPFFLSHLKFSDLQRANHGLLILVSVASDNHLTHHAIGVLLSSAEQARLHLSPEVW